MLGAALNHLPRATVQLQRRRCCLAPTNGAKAVSLPSLSLLDQLVITAKLLSIPPKRLSPRGAAPHANYVTFPAHLTAAMELGRKARRLAGVSRTCDLCDARVGIGSSCDNVKLHGAHFASVDGLFMPERLW